MTSHSQNFDKKKKVLITGGAGFIGSNVADQYIEAGYDVIIVDNLSTGNAKNIPQKAKFYQEDICNLEGLEKIFQKETPAIINHHAAQIDVRTSISNPQKDARINIIGAINLLELARKYKVSKLIYAGTGGALYGDVQNQLPTETISVHPLSHYGVSKYCSEHYFNLYAKLYHLNVTLLRYANVYGPRQNPMGEAGVIAIFIHAILSGETPTIYGNGEQARDFIYVEEVAKANLAAMDQGNGATINIGTGKMTTVNQLLHILKKETGFQGEPKYAPARAGEILKSGLDVTLAKTVLHWSSKISLKEGLKKTIAWQRQQT